MARAVKNQTFAEKIAASVRMAAAAAAGPIVDPKKDTPKRHSDDTLVSPDRPTPHRASGCAHQTLLHDVVINDHVQYNNSEQTVQKFKHVSILASAL